MIESKFKLIFFELVFFRLGIPSWKKTQKGLCIATKMLNYKQTSLRSFFKVIENDCSYEIAQKKRQRPTATLSVKPVQYSHSEDDDTIDDDIAPPSAKKFKLAEEIAPCTFASPPTAINFLKRKNRFVIFKNIDCALYR